MVTQSSIPVYTQGFATATVAGPLVTVRSPATTDVSGPAGPFKIGQLWVNSTSDLSYQLTSLHPSNGQLLATWSLLGGAAGVLDTLTGDTGGVITPVGGNIDILGTSGEIVTTGTAGTITLSLDNPLVIPGDVDIPGTLNVDGAVTLATTGASVNTIGNATGATSVAITSGTGSITLTSTGTGDIILDSDDTMLLDADGVLELNSSAGVISIGNDANNQNINLGTAGTRTIAIGSSTATETVLGTFNLNTTGSLVTTIGTGGTGAVAIGNATGNTAVTGSLTASTTLTATLGAITATNGNLVLGTAGNKILSTSVGTTTAAGANSFGTVTLTGGTATVATTAITTNSIVFLTRQTIGATGAAALGMLSRGTIINGTSFVINSLLTADATNLATTDVSSVGWFIVN